MLNARSCSLFRGLFVIVLGLIFFPAACSSNKPSEELVFYDWEGDMPQSVLDAFSTEYGIPVRYETYESQEEAIEKIRAQESYDLVVLESRFIPLMIDEGLLVRLDYRNIQNFKNVSPNFRDLAYDPGNAYSVPYSWGVTGLVVRTDGLKAPINEWGDIWDETHKGQVAIWVGQPREAIAITLKSLGYSVNSEDPSELNAALEKLIELKPHLKYVEDYDLETAAPALAGGDVVITMGYSGDFQAAMDEGLEVEFVIPKEGALLWGDNYVVPAISRNKETAELFIDFLLRPEISADIVNQKYYASANEAAREFVIPEILANPSIYPDNTVLKNAEIILPLTAQGQELYDEIWLKFLEFESN
jgi:spermidine/putrescine transport system substrate-binding protein